MGMNVGPLRGYPPGPIPTPPPRPGAERMTYLCEYCEHRLATPTDFCRNCGAQGRVILRVENQGDSVMRLGLLTREGLELGPQEANRFGWPATDSTGPR